MGMSKLTNIFKDLTSGDRVATRMKEYDRRYGGATRGGVDEHKTDYRNAGTFVNRYYDLVTDLYEYGWGQSFHFASRAHDESFAASITRHEHYIALKLGLRPGMAVVDLGCGIGGPSREIARFSGASILGVNNNDHQLTRAVKQTENARMTHLVDYLKCDFMNVPLPDASFDAGYSIEGTCCAPDKVGVYGEAFRLLKSGGYLAVYENCLTEQFDARNPRHLQLQADIEYGGGLSFLPLPHEVDDAMRHVGFEIVESRDIAATAPPGIPWYEPLVGSGLSFATFRSSAVGRQITSGLLWLLERLRIVPQGSAQVSTMLNLVADTFAEAGRLGIFSPMYFILARKPTRV